MTNPSPVSTVTASCKSSASAPVSDSGTSGGRIESAAPRNTSSVGSFALSINASPW